jgi:hypothetical protein
MKNDIRQKINDAQLELLIILGEYLKQQDKLHRAYDKLLELGKAANIKRRNYG